MCASRTANHLKFDDDDESAAVERSSALNGSKTKLVNDTRSSDDSDSGSEDEAPEEEAVSNGKVAIEEEVRRRQEAIQKEQQLLKEKRKKNDAFYKEQQQARKEKLSSHQDSTELEQLPIELLEKLEEVEQRGNVQKLPTHINFNEIDDETYAPEIRKELRDRKKKTLKQLRKTSARKGPVNVTVLSSAQSLRVMAPKKESKIMNTKDKWLRRKSLKRK